MMFFWYLAEKYRWSKDNPCGVVGFDCAANESDRFNNLKKRQTFVKIFKKVKEMNFGAYTHAGEGTSYESVKHAILDMQVSRIGHGYKCIDDEETMKLQEISNSFFIFLC